MINKTLDTLSKKFNVRIEPTQSSRLPEVDFDNLPFGRVFSDHMLICHYQNGSWAEPVIKPYGPLGFGPGLHALHYGQAVFEGMKAYRDVKNPESVHLFRPLENFHRLNASAERLAMPAIPEDIFMDGIKALVEIDKGWIPTAEGNSLYLRPFMFASGEVIMATPADDYTFIIITSPSSSYYNGTVRLKVEQEFTRAANGGTGYAKAAGNYAASFFPMLKAREEGFMQLLWTDAKEHKMVEEAGTMNFFMRKGNELVTPPTSDSILSGITRKSLLELAPTLGMNVNVRPISIAEVEEGLISGEVTEIFGVGTAAVVSPVSTFGLPHKNYDLEVLHTGWWKKLKDSITSIQFGASDDPFNWRVNII